jgi:hypothetical protein
MLCASRHQGHAMHDLDLGMFQRCIMAIDGVVSCALDVRWCLAGGLGFG